MCHPEINPNVEQAAATPQSSVEPTAAQAWQVIQSADQRALSDLRNCVSESALALDDGQRDIGMLVSTSWSVCAKHVQNVKSRVNYLGFLANGQTMDMVERDVEKEASLQVKQKRSANVN